MITGQGLGERSRSTSGAASTRRCIAAFSFSIPSKTLPRVRQPLLVVQPMLDREIPVHHGEQLAQLARSRPRAKTTDFVQLQGVNHLLARAVTGEVARVWHAGAAQRQPCGDARADLLAR